MSKKIVYENHWIVDKIYEVSDNIRNKLVDQTLFEERCITRVAEYLKDKNNIRNKRYIVRMIHEVAASSLERSKKEYATLFAELSVLDDESSEYLEFEPEDVLADVESEVIAKEMTALLAQDDHRDKTIVRSWLDGNTNTASISRLLAQSIGGNAKSHRVYIHRFKQSCQEELRELLEAV